MNLRRLVAALGLVATTLASGCSGVTGGGRDAGAALRLQVSGDREETQVFEALAEAYERRPGGRKVVVEVVEDEEDHLTKLATSTAGGDPPDAFVLNYRQYTAFAGRGALRPVGPLLRQRGLDPAALERAPVEAFTQGGELQCLPLNASSMVVYWNEALFEAAGLPAPRAGWTWQDLASAASRLTGGAADGIGIAPRLIRVAPFAWSLGGAIVDDEQRPTTTTFTSDAGVRALAFVRALAADFGPSAAERRSASLEVRFARGQLGMLLSSRRDVPRFREATDLRWDVAPVPQPSDVTVELPPIGAAGPSTTATTSTSTSATTSTGGDPGTTAGTGTASRPGSPPSPSSPPPAPRTSGAPTTILHADGACLSARGEQVGAAADLLAFLGSAEAQSLAALSGRFVPVQPSARGPFLDPARPPAGGQVFLDQLASTRRVPVVERWSAAEARADEVIERFFAEPGLQPAEAARLIDEASRRALATG